MTTFYTGDFAPEGLWASIRMRKAASRLGRSPLSGTTTRRWSGRGAVRGGQRGLARNRYACPTKAEGRPHRG